MSLPSHARVVIVGGGSLGVNLAYHLTEEGWTDIVLVEKGELTSGSTWHAAGLCPNFNGNHTLSKIHDYTIELYDKIIPAKTGLPSSFHTTGSLRIAYSELEEQWFRNIKSRAANVGCEMNLVSKQEAAEIAQVMTFPDARAILHTPNDGHVDPTSVIMPLGQMAREAGATFSRFNRVIDINVMDNGEFEVITEQGTIIAEHVVNCGGCFAPEVGAMVGVHVPMVNLEHQYLVTDDHPELAKLTRELPVVRDSRAASYIRQEGNGFLVGPYETRGAKPWALKGMDWSFDRGLFEGDLERIMPYLESCMELAPYFAEVGVKTVINGAITHTPDDNFLCGPSAEVRNFWMLSGASIGIAQGGIGKYMAQWMVHGQTELNMASLDSRRFGTWADKNYCITRAIESYERMYASAAPTENRPHGRPIRTSPLHTVMQQAGAEHFVTAGYEKPAWFHTAEVQKESESWAHNEAHGVVAEECAAVQNACGITDLSGSAKFRITGPDAYAFLDQLSSNKLPQTDGRIGLTLFHATKGGIMAELSVSRISANEFVLMGAIGSQIKDFQWLQQHKGNFDVVLEDITESWGGLLLTGPKARDILQQITTADLSNSAFPWLSCQTIQLDSAPVFAMRVSYAGELGWELYMPVWQLISIYESLMEFGSPMGLRNFGSRAFNAMRMEKAYRAYGHEFTEEISGLEAGMERFIDLQRDFIGADNLRQRQQDGLTMELAYLVFDDAIAAECFGNEAVYADGKLTGIVTGGAYGYRVSKSLAFAYVAPEHAKAGTKLTVESSLGTRQCHVEMTAAYDAENTKLRA